MAVAFHQSENSESLCGGAAFARPDYDRAMRQGAGEVIYGEGKTAEAAARHHLPVLAEMPIDPALAALTDAGDIESFQGSWLESAADRLENK